MRQADRALSAGSLLGGYVRIIYLCYCVLYYYYKINTSERGKYYEIWCKYMPFASFKITPRQLIHVNLGSTLMSTSMKWKEGGGGTLMFAKLYTVTFAYMVRYIVIISNVSYSVC